VSRVLERADVDCFRTLVAERLGLSFEDDRFDFLRDVLRHRMDSTGSERFSSYKRRLSSYAIDPEEVRAVAEQLTVGETFFFRYADHFRAFTEAVLPDRARAQDRRRQLRILSAGCASGDEAYSLAILIKDRLSHLTSWSIEIRGIDVNASMVKKASTARYTTWSLRDTPAELRAKYFSASGRDFLLDDAVRSMVVFEERNLVDDAPSFWKPDAFDVVFCRNVTMYFTPEAARSAIKRIAGSLTPGGFLFLGHAETLRGLSQDFHLRHTHDTFYYQRRDGSEESAAGISSPAAAGDAPAAAYVPAVSAPSDSWFDVIQRASERITDLTDKSRSASIRANGTAPAAATARPPVPAWDRTLAIELLREEKFAQATELMRGLPAESSSDPDAQLLLAVLLTNRGSLSEAEKVCERLLALDELNAGAHYLMALSREHAGDRAAAIEHDRAAVYLDSAFAMPHLHLGLLAKRSGQKDTAKGELTRAMALLAREDASRIFLFGGGFTRETLAEFCRTELLACGATDE